MTVVTKPLTAAEKKKEAEANSSPLVQVETENIKIEYFKENLITRLNLKMTSSHSKLLTNLTFTSPTSPWQEG